MELAPQAACKCCFQEPQMVAQGHIPVTSPSLSPVSIPAPVTTLVPIEDFSVPIINAMPPEVPNNQEAM